MLTTIQENVTVGYDGYIHLKVPNLKCNSKLSVVAVIETENIKLENMKEKRKSLAGALSEYANPKLISLEKDVFANAMEEKHATR